MLIEKGINPATFFKETIFAGSHDKVIAARAGWSSGCRRDLRWRTRSCALTRIDRESDHTSSDPIPHDAIAVRIGMDETLVKKIQLTLINLEKSEARPSSHRSQ